MPLKDVEARRRNHAEYMRNVWYPRNREKQIAMVARSSKKRRDKIVDAISGLKVQCSQCGESHPATLDFHHRDKSEKEFSISTAVANGSSLKRILAEIKKCDVLCSNCHRKVHWDKD